jgi:hypothetical protein
LITQVFIFWRVAARFRRLTESGAKPILAM